MSPLWITDADVRRLLSVEEAIPLVEAVLRQQAVGAATNMPRGHTVAGPVAAPGVMLAHMSAALHEQGVFGFKVYSIVGGEYRFFVLLYGMQTGDLLAVIEAAALGRLRTGAASGVSVMHMARENSAEIGILGSGFQADAQLEAICSVRTIERVRVFSRNPTNRSDFARRMTDTLGIEVQAADNPHDVVERADILVTITNSPTPEFSGEWLCSGTHICAVGGANEYVTELDDATISRADIIAVDSIAQAKIECGELMMPTSRGLLLWEQVSELHQIVGGMKPGRHGADDITLFKSLGMAMWDLAAAKTVYDRYIS
ncbi:MAG: ornithine cyclodeaminase family protein [Chloroflexi bacterium]|nr:ornithine cyclodeaminase family protein [Chloroflexota bacterium]